MAPGGDGHSTKGEYDSKGLSKPSLACYRGGACKKSALGLRAWRDSQSMRSAQELASNTADF